jgi:hypothetical protein
MTEAAEAAKVRIAAAAKPGVSLPALLAGSVVTSVNDCAAAGWWRRGVRGAPHSTPRLQLGHCSWGHRCGAALGRRAACAGRRDV